MSLFVDQLLVQLRDPAQLAQLIAPASDPTHARLRTLLDAVYEMPFATIHDVRNVQVRRTEFEQPVFPPKRTQGTWTQTMPSYTRTDIVYEGGDVLMPTWLDLSAEVGLTLVLEVDSGEVASILTREVDGFNTLDEFRARFRFFNVDAFMAENNIATFAELKERAKYLVTEIQLKPQPPFDPNAPGNQHRYTLNLAILIRDSVDVAATLRQAKLARIALERALTFRRETETAGVRTPYAALALFPEAALAGLPFTGDTLTTFFATERVLALFVTPS
jgi:hypothetical protein